MLKQAGRCYCSQKTNSNKGKKDSTNGSICHFTLSLTKIVLALLPHLEVILDVSFPCIKPTSKCFDPFFPFSPIKAIACS